MVIDVSENFGRQPIKHVVRSRKSRTMFCDFCNPTRKLVWHAEENRVLCPQCGRTPQVLQDKLAELANEEPSSESGGGGSSSENRPKLVTADGFESSGNPYNLTSLKMRAKYGPRSMTTISKEEFPDLDDDTKNMLERNPDYRLVDYQVNDPE